MIRSLTWQAKRTVSSIDRRGVGALLVHFTRRLRFARLMSTRSRWTSHRKEDGNHCFLYVCAKWRKKSRSKSTLSCFCFPTFSTTRTVSNRIRGLSPRSDKCESPTRSELEDWSPCVEARHKERLGRRIEPMCREIFCWEPIHPDRMGEEWIEFGTCPWRHGIPELTLPPSESLLRLFPKIPEGVPACQSFRQSWYRIHLFTHLWVRGYG